MKYRTLYISEIYPIIDHINKLYCPIELGGSYDESLGASLMKEWIITRVYGDNLLKLASQF